MENIEEHSEEHIKDQDVLQSLDTLSNTSNTNLTSKLAFGSSNSFSKNLGSGSSTSMSASGTASQSPSTSTMASNTSAAASAVKRMPHLHKLEKKHSSGDLHSRLKTRKLLGVGETDDGDIHRSKLSQILGHSDQLYIRLPYGLRIWQLMIAVMFTFTGLWALIFPCNLFDSAPNDSGVDTVTLPGRLYGGAILSLSILYWATLSSQDRDVIRICMLTSVVYFVIQFIATSWHLLVSPNNVARNELLQVSFRGFCMLLSFFYHWALVTRKYSGLKMSSSNKELSKEK